MVLCIAGCLAFLASLLKQIFVSSWKKFEALKHELLQDRNKDADVENGLEDTGRGKGKLGQSERVALTYIHYQM